MALPVRSMARTKVTRIRHSASTPEPVEPSGRGLLTPSQARRRTFNIVNGQRRMSWDPIPAKPLRWRNHATRPVVAARLGKDATIIGGAPSTANVDVAISNDDNIKNIALKAVEQEVLNRWFAITHGSLPKGEEAHPTDDEVTQRELDAIRPIEAASKAATEEREAALRSLVSRLNADAEVLREDPNPETRPYSLRRARQIDAQIEQAQADAEAEEAAAADRTNAQRHEVQDEITEEARKERETYIENRLEELRDILDEEVQEEVEREFKGNNADGYVTYKHDTLTFK